MTERKKNSGFTVIELVIALTIFVIVGAMTTIIFRSTQQSFINAKAFQHVIDLARDTVVRMHSEIQGAFIDPSGLCSFVGIDSIEVKIKGSDSGADEIFFVVPSDGEASGSMCEVGYWQKDSDGNIMRHFECPPDFDYLTPAAADDSELGLVISNLNFSYFDGTKYVDSWDSRSGEQKGLYPRIVKFSFLVSDKANIVEKKFESLVQIASSAR